MAKQRSARPLPDRPASSVALPDGDGTPASTGSAAQVSGRTPRTGLRRFAFRTALGLAVLAPICGLVFGVTGLLHSQQRFRALLTTTGTVTGSVLDNRDPSKPLNCPLITFTTAQHQQVTVQFPSCDPQSPTLGLQQPVLYDPANPQNAGNPERHAYLSMMLMNLSAFLLVFFGVRAFKARMARKRRGSAV